MSAQPNSRELCAVDHTSPAPLTSDEVKKAAHRYDTDERRDDVGLDLTLIPINMGPPFKVWLGHSRVALERQYDVFTQIPGCHYRGEEYRYEPVAESCELDPPTAVAMYTGGGDEGYEHRTEDPYGTPLTYMLAGDLGKVDVEGASPWNKAAFVFIRALPETMPVVLWWN